MLRRGSIFASFPSALFFRKWEETGLAIASVGLNNLLFWVSRFMAGRDDTAQEEEMLVVVEEVGCLAGCLAAPGIGTIVARPSTDFRSPLFRRAAKERCAIARRGSRRFLF